MLSLDLIRVFYYVAQERSIVRAADLLNMPRSSLGKQIQALENDCDFTLFIRRKSGLELTPKGEELFRLARKSMSALEEDIWKFKQGKEPQRQVLRIITTTGISHLILISKLRDFRDIFPTVQIRVQTTNDYVDFLASGADVGILPKVSDSYEVSQRRIFKTPLKIYASKDYLDDYGTPATFEDLKIHDLVSFHSERETHRGPIDWHIDILGRGALSPSVSINSLIGIMWAIKNGLGIGILPTSMPFLDKCNLISLFDEQISLDTDVFFVTKREEHLNGDGIVATLFKLLDGIQE